MLRNLAIVLALCWSLPTMAAIVLDQEQMICDGGLGARSLPDYEVGQSFAAGQTGTLTRIDVQFFSGISGDGINGDGTLAVYSGEGKSGALLATAYVNVQAPDSGVSWNFFAITAPVVSGQQYTFIFTPNLATMPDIYGVAIGPMDTAYAGGNEIQFYPGDWVDVETRFDLVFRTFVNTPEPSAPVGLLATAALALRRKRGRTR